MIAEAMNALKKPFIIMKLTLILIVFCTFQTLAGVNAQTITYSAENREIAKVLSSIERKGDFRFLYNSRLKDLKQKVSVNFTKADITDALKQLFNGTSLTYVVLENNLIAIRSGDPAEADIKVEGRVTNEAGEPVIGASISVKGSGAGTFTDATGSFSITVPENAVLVVSAVGYTSTEVSVNGRAQITVRLVQSEKKMDEVVVIGYGTASRRDLTGSVVKVKGEELAAQPNTNPLSSLQSKVAGLNIVNTAIPGSAPDVRIRGTISIGTVRPVYIIDGIFSDNMDFVNPSEIESVEILKDPSSLAVFGIKGAAGAILVTTKKAKAGQVNINFNTTFGTKTLVDKIAMANGDQFRSLLTFEANNRVQDDPSGGGSLLDFVNNGMPAYTGNTDWVDAVTRNAKFTTTNLGVDASTEKNRFHFGLGYTYDEGLVKHVRYDRLTLNLNDEFKINKRWKLGFGIIGSKERLPYGSGALEEARRALPIIPSGTTPFYIKNPYGVDSGFYNLYATTPIIQNSETNPLATLENNWDKIIDDRYRLIGNVFVDVNITKDLNFRSTWYGNFSWRNKREYTPLYNLYNPVDNTVFAKNNLTAVRQDLINSRDFQQDYIATYKKRFGDHNFNFTAGFTTFYHYYEQVAGTASQSTPGISIIPNDKSFWYLNSGFGDRKSIIASGTFQDDYATVSGLARVLYNYKNKYYLNASFRRDGSSQINTEYKNKFQNFWALGGAWELTREKFMENQKIFDFLKIKASTGLLGNFTAQGKAYPAYPTISSNSSAVFGSNFIPVYVADYSRDPNLHWETVKSTEIGIETDLLNSRLHFEAAYYHKKTEDLIVLLSPQGQLQTLTNNGSIKNNGFEFAANWNQKITKDFSFSVGGNLTTYKNKVLSLPLPLRQSISSSEATPNQAETGFPIGYFYGFVVEGIYQSYTDILQSAVSTVNGGNAKPGDLKYKDLDGNDIIDDKDRTIIGNPTPDFTYGITAAFRYKAFDLSVDMAGSYGNEIYRVWGTSEQKNSVYNFPAYYTEGWTEAGSSNWVPIVNQFHLINRAPSTYGIEDGSYIRIRNVTLSYTLSSLPKMTYIKNLRLSVGVQNLKTWKNNMGYSPEFAGDANSPATSFGMDFGSAGSALPRIITVGLNVNF